MKPVNLKRVGTLHIFCVGRKIRGAARLRYFGFNPRSIVLLLYSHTAYTLRINRTFIVLFVR